MNEEKKTNKGLMAFLVIFAVIGVLSVLGLGVIGVLSLVDKYANKANQVSSETVELENTDANEANAADGNVDALNEAITEGLESEVPEALAEAKLPDTTSNGNMGVVGDGELKMVFLGDSIIDNVRDDTGVCNIVARELNATVYNLGVGGCSASIPREDSLGDTTPKGQVSGSISGAALAEVMAGYYPDNNIMDCTAKKILKENLEEIKSADIYVIEYGLNDFMYGRDNCNYDNLLDPTTYEGGLRHVVGAIRSFNPDALIMLCEPSYAYYNRPNGEWIGDSYSLDNGLGRLVDYAGKTDYVATDMNCAIYKLEFQGVGPQNLDETILDGVHFTEAGRKLYAESLVATFIRQGILDEDGRMIKKEE